MSFNSKFFFTLIGLIVAVFAICNTDISPSVNEGFWGNHSRGVRLERVLHDKNNGQMTSLGPIGHPMRGHDKFVSYPSFQSQLSPRFSNTQYGAQINYNFPSSDNLAVPREPMAFGDMAREDYCGGGSSCSSVPNCGKGGVSLDKNNKKNIENMDDYNTDYVNAMNKVYDEYGEPAGSSMVSVGDMTTLDPQGKEKAQVVYNRYIFAQKKSHQRSKACPVRGDVFIKPIKRGMFDRHPDIAADLNPGALNVIAGNLEENKKLQAAISESSGGYGSTFNSDCDMSLSNDLNTSLGAGMGDIQVSSFA